MNTSPTAGGEGGGGEGRGGEERGGEVRGGEGRGGELVWEVGEKRTKRSKQT